MSQLKLRGATTKLRYHRGTCLGIDAINVFSTEGSSSTFVDTICFIPKATAKPPCWVTILDLEKARSLGNSCIPRCNPIMMITRLCPILDKSVQGDNTGSKDSTIQKPISHRRMSRERDFVRSMEGRIIGLDNSETISWLVLGLSFEAQKGI
ncbi:hypothetical protein RRG08_035360 [Elysia crispata]|uniref:Uncharacterized protein n=1 Tax=Elysia crispata TaxID=231223 RepID=A0AAE0Y4W2_9GAST|nr:hypothetical protein RRG08_035360 [Elysia crispata]